MGLIQPTESDLSKDETAVTNDLSKRVIRLARMIDRLPLNGNYMIRIVKPDTKYQRWVIEIVKLEDVSSAEL